MEGSNVVVVEIEATVHPTEDGEKVARAIGNIFPDMKLVERKTEGGYYFLQARAESKGALSNFRFLLKRERIRNAARTVMFSGLEPTSISFFLNKQVAYVNHISFSQPTGESPLGPIAVRIRCSEPVAIVDWLTSKRHT